MSVNTNSPISGSPVSNEPVSNEPVSNGPGSSDSISREATLSEPKDHALDHTLEHTQAAGVALRSVTKKYGSVTALENVTLDIPAGVYCCLLGPSGCGKTTALRLISGHETATSGQIVIGDRVVNDLPAAKRNTAMMFQNYALFPHKTIWQNVEFGLKMQRISKAERRRRVNEMLELVGLANTAARKPDMLSGGQQQRIALARALVTRPKVLMLDEPLSALDENLRVRMRGELRKMQKQFGLTFIQVTHHVEEAFSLSDQIVVMDHGHIEQVATPTELFTTPSSQFVAKFIGDNNIFSGQVVNVEAGAGKALGSAASNGVVSNGAVSNNDLIELAVEGIGSLFCCGTAATNAATPSDTRSDPLTVACSVRPDLLVLSSSMDSAVDSSIASSVAGPPKNKASPAGRSPEKSLENQLQARIVDVELTGYVTRVTLMVESTGQSLLHKSRTTDWQVSGFGVGDRVTVSWFAEDCVFLPY